MRESEVTRTPMAEARVAVSELRVPPNLEEGRDSWKDLYMGLRKSVTRRYYRTRNSFRNGTWPTSTNNLIAVFLLTLSLMLGEPEATKSFNQFLWRTADSIFDPEGAPRWLRATIVAWVIGILSFSILMKVRQYTLRILLAYRGWLYEPIKSQSLKTTVWAILVKMVSGYQPSLYSCQRSLPRLPVPNLHSTVEKLLESLQPLCSKEELMELKREAEEFENGVGTKLQRILILKSWWAPNYVTDWWEKYVYLMTRTPLAINSNYYGLDHSYWSPTKSQTVRAATTIYHIMNFKRLIDREELPPLVLRNTIPICMAQYERLFSSIRIPGVDSDRIRHYDSKVSRHIVVQAKGFYYVVEVYDSKNQILSPLAFKAQFDWILQDAEVQLEAAQVSETARSISALTALPRTEWANLRKEYFRNGVNREAMKAIQESILVVVLSDEKPVSLTEKGKYLLHADGKSLWFDKCVNVVFFKNGHCGLNVEHTMADAPAMGHCWEYAMTKDILERFYTDEGDCMPLPKSFRQGKFKRPSRMAWEINANLASHIEKAVQFAQKNNADLDLVIKDHDKWGKGVIKLCKISPDAFVQAALQLAYYRDAGTFAQTYEASMTRLYSCGRTETVRSCTTETAEFVKAMTEDNHTVEEKIRLLKKAADKHQQMYRDSMNGGGIDRHLFALFVCCKGLGLSSPFLEKVLLRPWTLSTSQQPQQQLQHVPDINLPMFEDKVSPGGGFGPVSDDGYGVSYMLPSDHKIFFHITSKHSSSKTSSTRFANNIFQALEDMKQLYEPTFLEKSKSE